MQYSEIVWAAIKNIDSGNNVQLNVHGIRWRTVATRIRLIYKTFHNSRLWQIVTISREFKSSSRTRPSWWRAVLRGCYEIVSLHNKRERNDTNYSVATLRWTILLWLAGVSVSLARRRCDAARISFTPPEAEVRLDTSTLCSAGYERLNCGLYLLSSDGDFCVFSVPFACCFS